MSVKLRIVLVALSLAVLAQAQVPLNGIPTLAIGYPPELSPSTLVSSGPNLVDNRGLSSPQGIAFDPTSNAVYVADTSNNRVLAWQDGVGFFNGAPADLVIGQKDQYSNGTNNPGFGLEAGLSLPGALTVNSQGDLWVYDAGNNRVVKFRQPFQQQVTPRIISQVLGQPNKTSNSAGTANNRFDFVVGSTVSSGGLVFDAQGNLWVSDYDNSRVLRFAAADLGDGGQDGVAAEMVLGQDDFNSRVALPGTLSANNRTNKDGFRQPTGIGMDSAGVLYVCDALSRVLVFVPPFPPNGIRALATRIMGITMQGPGEPTPTAINDESLTFPVGVFGAGDKIFVVDTQASRVLRYPRYSTTNWPPEGPNFFSPPAEAVIGQFTFNSDANSASELVNHGLAAPNDTSLATPTAGAFAHNQVYIVDTGNNRVVAYDNITEGPATAQGDPYVIRRVLGQIHPDFGTRNLIEGKEFDFNIDGDGAVIDNSSDPPRLYVADTGNNRILAFADARKVRAGDQADLVIGQSDLYRSMINAPDGFSTTLNKTGLFGPSAVATDAQGNVWVADTGNGRVLRFPNPFEAAKNASGFFEADLVLGQFDFTSKTGIQSALTMGAPYDLAFTQQGHLLVSDPGFNRVVLFLAPFASSQAAVKVFGQAQFDTKSGGSGPTQLNGPRGISTDTDDRLYVADLSNKRVQIFPNVVQGSTPSGASATLSITKDRTGNLDQPRDVFVSPRTGEMFVADSNRFVGGGVLRGRISRYPKFDTLSNPSQGGVAESEINYPSPVSVTLDDSDNLYVSDAYSRFNAFFKSFLSLTNAADQEPRLAPGMWTTAKFYPGTFSAPSENPGGHVGPVPLLFDLADLQILVNGEPMPIWFVTDGNGGNGQINFVIGNNVAQGLTEFLLFRVSTQQIIAAANNVNIERVSPAFFTNSGTGEGDLAAINNADGTRNGPDHPVQIDQYIQLYLTGAGNLPGSPPDGQLAPSNPLVNTPTKPRVFFQALELPPEDIQFSGLAPGQAHLWQLNIKVPGSVAINGQNQVFIRDYEGATSQKLVYVWVQR